MKNNEMEKIEFREFTDKKKNKKITVRVKYKSLDFVKIFIVTSFVGKHSQLLENYFNETINADKLKSLYDGFELTFKIIDIAGN